MNEPECEIRNLDADDPEILADLEAPEDHARWSVLPVGIRYGTSP